MRTFLIFCSSTEHLAKGLRRKIKIKKAIFPDGELYVKILGLDKLKQGRIIILHSGAPSPNSGLIELEMILQILKDREIRPEIFFTYFPYGRQDRVFEVGETNAAEELVKKLINYYKARKIYIIDPHFGGRDWVKKYPVVSISAVPLLIKRVKQDWGQDILFLSPDKGGQRRTAIPGLEKKRINSFKTRQFSPKTVLKGGKVAVIDDIIGTGGTLLKCYDMLKKSGAKQIFALVSHGVLAEGVKKIKNKFTKLYLANTVNQKQANIDITNLIERILKKGWV